MKLRKRLKGFTLAQMPTLIITFVIAVIVASVGTDVVNEVQNVQDYDDPAFNHSREGLEGMTQISNWFEIIGLVVAASIVLGILFVYFIRR